MSTTHRPPTALPGGHSSGDSPEEAAHDLTFGSEPSLSTTVGVSTSRNHIGFVDVNGLRLRISVEGSGPPLLLINGIGANMELLRPLRNCLGGLETIAFDAPGTGGSETTRCPYRPSSIASLVMSMLDRLGFRRVSVLGYSWGGGIAQQIAHQFPNRVERLILCATSPGQLMVPGSPRVLRTMLTPRRYFSATYMEEIAPILYGGEIRQQPDLLHQQGHARATRPPSLLGYSYQLMAIWGWSSLPWLSRLRQPTLIVAGDDDPIVPLANAKLMGWLIPDSRVLVVDGGGHLFAVVRPEHIAPEIVEFLVCTPAT